MSDIAILPANSPDVKANNAKAFVPTYLVQVKTITGKAVEYFVAVRYDASENYVKCVGFYSKEQPQNIITQYEALVQNTPKNDYIEVWFPWGEIKQVQSLVYRHR